MANEYPGVFDDWGMGDYRARSSLHAWMQLKVRFFVCLLFAHALAGCGGGGNGQSTFPAPTPTAQSAPVPPPMVTPESGDAWQGRYVGTVTIGDVRYFGDAILTADGLIRLYVGGPGGNDGTIQMTV